MRNTQLNLDFKLKNPNLSLFIAIYSYLHCYLFFFIKMYPFPFRDFFFTFTQIAFGHEFTPFLRFFYCQHMITTLGLRTPAPSTHPRYKKKTDFT